MRLGAALVDALEFCALSDPLSGPKFHYSSLTVRRFRPFARRRFKTRRPFFVLILTRNPCVRERRRVLGWNVRFPFMRPLPESDETPIISEVFEGCQCTSDCATLASLSRLPSTARPHARLV
jgi:hypothetical protein